MYVKVDKQQKHEQRRGKVLCFNFIVISLVLGTFLCVLTYANNVSYDNTRVLRPPRPKKQTEKANFSVQNFTWSCVSNRCEKIVFHQGTQVSLQTCNMLCSSPPLWPKPKKLTTSNKNYSVTSLASILFTFTDQEPVSGMLQNSTSTFLSNLESPISNTTGTVKVLVNIIVEDSTTAKLSLSSDESYALSITKDSDKCAVEIGARNFFGARHALETLSQLIWYDPISKELRILHDIQIEDKPAFPYRGIMIDTARNFFPVHQLKKIVDGMSYCKLNMLHLHVTDSASFPIVLPSVKELAEYGAYSADMIYTPEDIRHLVRYAQIRGVKVILEVDAPSHTRAGWEFAEDYYGKKFITCEDSVGNGHLDPNSDEVLNILEYIYGDLLDLSDQNELFHIGNDEVSLYCWAKSTAGTKFWSDYTNTMLERLRSANRNVLPKNIIMWSSPLTESTYLKDIAGNITVQYWFGKVNNVLLTGKSVIYSTVGEWYLDCGFGPWNPGMRAGNCDPYTPWQKFYNYRPWIEHGHQSQTLGGEVCLWSEQVDVDSLETRVWPRSAAFAERVWTDPTTFDTHDVYGRLDVHRARLIKRGLKAAAMWPQWCTQNPGKCGFS